MKKKIISLCLIAVLLLTAIGGATLAYFTDTESATNTFTTAKVDIQLIEQQRSADGSKLEDFTQDKKLFPVNGDAQGTKDKWGLPTAKNYVDKIVTVKNLEEDAYVRVYIAVPAALENAVAAKNILHWNIGNKFTAAGDYTGNSNTADYTTNMGKCVQLTGTTKIGEVEYNVYYQTYKKALTKNEVTGSAFMVGMYLDSKVDHDGNSYTINGENIDFDLSNVTIPVIAVGAQVAGFEEEGADAAINAAFGEKFNPWDTN